MGGSRRKEEKKPHSKGVGGDHIQDQPPINNIEAAEPPEGGCMTMTTTRRCCDAQCMVYGKWRVGGSGEESGGLGYGYEQRDK